ncbi:hypothetical protein BD410DRAFT_726349 [Rickenella mellea]|uniref:2OGFeDO JBP1/TET oxygenase domain-containing protein n=1 Tax=Rickenella mellea TaxID=50990 RepID=A0A4Y7PXX8_9AGAM|nr:hypothetical protein BD410DRAFT_726349 [Rickenella mellea]
MESCRTPRPVVDEGGRTFMVLAGRPDDRQFDCKSWGDVTMEAERRLEVDGEMLIFDIKDVQHRRGDFPAINVGLSFGHGQPHPIVRGNGKNGPVLNDLMESWPMQRIAGYVNSQFAMWAPRLHHEYVSYQQKIYEKNPTLQPLYPNHAFTNAAFNFGGKVVTFPHVDHRNVPHGWCSITSLGSYDYRKGGHVVLWDLGLVVQFPPGSTTFLPSATMRHSNTAIGEGEKRFSITHYTCGGLFRWVDYGFRTMKEVMKKDKQGFRAVEASRANFGEQALKKYSTLSELRKNAGCK